MTRLKIAAAAVLAAVARVVGVVAVGSWRPRRRPGPRRMPQAGAEMKRPPAAGDAAAPAPAPAAIVEVRGRVVDPDGRPVPGATVRSGLASNRRTAPCPDATSGAGRPVRPADPAVGPRAPSVHAQRRAMRCPGSSPRPRGSGPAGPLASSSADDPGELTVRLVEDGPPIEGRIVDLEGRPVAGARVKVHRLWFARDERSWHVETGDLPAWLRRVQDLGLRDRALGRPVGVADGDRRRHDRPRRPLPPDGDRPRADRRAADLGPDDRHDPDLCDVPRRAGGPLHGPGLAGRAGRSSSTPRGSSTPRRRASRSRA